MKIFYNIPVYTEYSITNNITERAFKTTGARYANYVIIKYI